MRVEDLIKYLRDVEQEHGNVYVEDVHGVELSFADLHLFRDGCDKVISVLFDVGD